MYRRRRQHTMALLALIVAVVMTASCNDVPADAAARAELGPLTDTVWIGALEGDGPAVFGSIAALAVDAQGAIHVFDGRAYELRIFGPDGTFLSKYGRRGSGPGEFQHVIGMVITPEPRVWLVDGANARYTVLHNDEVRTHPRGAGVYNATWVGGYASGYLHDVVILPGQTASNALVRVDTAGVAVDTFGVPAGTTEAPRIGSIRLPIPYAPEDLRAFDPMGTLWMATSHEYALHEVSLLGDTIRVVRRDVSPRPLSDLEADSVARHMRALRSEFQLDVPDAMIPRKAPLLRHLTVGADGSLWVTRGDATNGGRTQLDVFDSRGRLLGEVVVGFPLRLKVVQNGRLYGVATDELGVERVFSARFRTQP
jgi:hypothetical protein